jgi:hypothetical protein
LKEQYLEKKKAVGRPGLQYLQQVVRNTAADSYTAMIRKACNNSRWKAANQSKDKRIRRKRVKYLIDHNYNIWMLINFNNYH